MWLTNTANYTGDSAATVVSAGVLAIAGTNSLPSGNLSLNGGLLQMGAGTLARSSGKGSGAIQLPGGDSGFVAQNGPVTINLGAASSLTWSGMGSFNPSILELQNVSSNTSIGSTTLSVGTLSLVGTNTVNVPPGIDTYTWTGTGTQGTLTGSTYSIVTAYTYGTGSGITPGNTSTLNVNCSAPPVPRPRLVAARWS